MHENDPAPTYDGPPVVHAPAESRLEALCAEYAAIKPEADELAKRLKDVVDGIKAETMAAAPEGETSVVLRSAALPDAYRVHAVESMALDTRRLKAEDPLTYASYTAKRVSWRLDKIK